MPTPRQGAFLAHHTLEVGFGGAAGGGKSAGLLMAALQFVQTPGYHAILLRRTFADLNLPEALIPLSHEWLSGTDAKWNQQNHQWIFPAPATLTFGYCENERDVYRYQSSAFAFIGWDELTQFTEFPYRYLFSRNRKRADLPIPLRVRAGFNPGGVGHDWVRQRFLIERHPKRVFIPARLEDNPHLDREAYEETLAKLDPITRAQLRHGDWEIRPEGNLFKRAWFADKIVENQPREVRTRVRYWDLAATEEAPGADPDYTAGVRMSQDHRGDFYVEDSQEFRATPKDVEDTIRATAQADGRDVTVYIEQEPGASGKTVIDHYQRTVLPGYSVYGVKSTGDKMLRAKPFSAACENGMVRLVRGTWIGRFLDRLTGFGLPGVHDDTTDAASGAHRQLTDHDEPWSERDVRDAFDAPAEDLDNPAPDPSMTWRERILARANGESLDNYEEL